MGRIVQDFCKRLLCEIGSCESNFTRKHSYSSRNEAEAFTWHQEGEGAFKLGEACMARLLGTHPRRFLLHFCSHRCEATTLALTISSIQLGLCFILFTNILLRKLSSLQKNRKNCISTLVFSSQEIVSVCLSLPSLSLCVCLSLTHQSI